MSYYQWCGPDGDGGSFNEGDYLMGEIVSHANHYTGSGFTPAAPKRRLYVWGIEAAVRLARAA